MGRPKKSAVLGEDETPEEEMGHEVPAGENGVSEGETDTLSDDDLIGESESREPEQAEPIGSEDNAEGSVEPDVAEDTAGLSEVNLPEGFLEMKIAPTSGIRVMLYTPAGDYLRAFCKRSRRFIDRRWQMSEKWCDAVTGKDIDFEPLGWRSLAAGE